MHMGKFNPPIIFKNSHKHILVQLCSCPLHMRDHNTLNLNGGNTHGRKTIGRTDIWPKGIWSNGHMTERQITERTCGHKTFDRKDISPKGQMTEKHGETNIWPKQNLTQNTQDWKNRSQSHYTVLHLAAKKSTEWHKFENWKPMYGSRVT